jgi:hypothetical protein
MLILPPVKDLLGKSKTVPIKMTNYFVDTKA